MPRPAPDVLADYAQPAPMTAPDAYASLTAGLPREVPALVACVQGLVLHVFWAERYGVSLGEERKAEVQIRPVERKLARILELDPRPPEGWQP